MASSTRNPFAATTYAPTESAKLHVPPTEEVCKVLKDTLKKNFQAVTVEEVECPDLTESPFNLAAPGICGSARLADVGGVPNLSPIVKRDRIYTMGQVATECQLPGAFILGAGAGSSQLTGINCELMPNTNLGTGQINTSYAKVDKNGALDLYHYDSNEFGLLANLFLSEGKPGKVIKVTAITRTGEKNFVTCMREGLGEHFKDQAVGLGGLFVIRSGEAKLHCMPDFVEGELKDEDVNDWLKFYRCHAPLTCLSVFVSHDPGLSLRVEHTHCFSEHGEGGHYHYDETPADVSYEAYFSVAEEVYRVDRPVAAKM